MNGRFELQIFCEEHNVMVEGPQRLVLEAEDPREQKYSMILNNFECSAGYTDCDDTWVMILKTPVKLERNLMK